MISIEERIITLRSRCLERKTKQWKERRPWIARSMQKSRELPWQIRMGYRSREILESISFEMDDLELLAGRMKHVQFSDEELNKAQAELSKYQWPGGQTGHCEPEYGLLLQLGIDGLREKILKQHAKADAIGKEACDSFLIALDGFSAMIETAAETVEKTATGAPAWRRKELCEISQSCRRIAHHPPENFRDAVQLMYFVICGVMMADCVSYVAPGHVDRTLAPFYFKGIENGSLDREKALALLESLYLLINEFVPNGGAMAVMVGGRDATGADVTNDLSYTALEALRRTNLVYPTVGICWHEGTSDKLAALAIELISKGYTTPAFFGDEIIQKGLKQIGVPNDEACRYINSTCVEITPSGASNVWVASPYFSVCGVLLEEIKNRAKNGDKPRTFADFLKAYKHRLSGVICAGAAAQNQLREGRKKFGGKPLQSVFTNDCIEKCRDIDAGGARYNWVECSFVGLANLIDSLEVIRREIFADRKLTFPELRRILDRNFDGGENIRQRFLSVYPKYGQDVPEVDAMFSDMVEFVQAECKKYRLDPENSPFVPGAFCWIMHERLGRECGATPDGRKTGTPFADGCGPAQGREKNGPTSAIMSTTSWNHSPMIGGLAYNMKFNTTLFRGDCGRDRLRDLVLTFLRRGGFETQINVVDNETLKKAKANPEQYRDLVVRIGGYTDYFTKLSPEMQDEVMLRTGFNAF